MRRLAADSFRTGYTRFMIALRPIIAVLAIVVGPAVAAYILFAGEGPPGPAELAVAGLFILVSAALTRGAVIQPLRALSFWRRFARERGHEFFGTLSREPRVKGTYQGRRFVAGLSTILGASDVQNRYRTVISVPVEKGIPAGFRAYGRGELTWVHEQSGKREVSTGDEDVEGSLICEGRDAESVRAFILNPQNREAILEFVERYPALLIHGAESDELPAEPGGASGVVTVALHGRVSAAGELDAHIGDVARLAALLDR